MPSHNLESHCGNKLLLSTKETDSETSYVEMGVRVCNQFNDAEYHALCVLKQILGGSMSARLFEEFREKRGLTYNSAVRVDLYEPAGVFVICAKTDTVRLLNDGKSPGVLPTIITILETLIKNGVKEREVNWAKTRIYEMILMNSDDLIQKCEYNGTRLLLHNELRILSHKDTYNLYYKHITKAVIDSIIQKYFAPRIYYLSIVGGKLPKKTDIAKIMEHG
jgi:predicted Zn-dependent peptidase